MEFYGRIVTEGFLQLCCREMTTSLTMLQTLEYSKYPRGVDGACSDDSEEGYMQVPGGKGVFIDIFVTLCFEVAIRRTQ